MAGRGAGAHAEGNAVGLKKGEMRKQCPIRFWPLLALIPVLLGHFAMAQTGPGGEYRVPT